MKIIVSKSQKILIFNLIVSWINFNDPIILLRKSESVNGRVI